MTILTKEQVEALGDTLSPMERVLNAYQAAPDLHDTCLALFDEVDGAKADADNWSEKCEAAETEVSDWLP